MKKLIQKILLEKLENVLVKPPSLVGWIKKNRVNNSHFPFSLEAFPFQKKILKALSKKGIEKVVIQSGSQLGKTELFLNLILYWIFHRGGNILVCFSDREMGRQFLDTRLTPLIESDPSLMAVFPEESDSKKTNRIDSRSYRTSFKGKIFIRSGRTASSYRALAASLVILDEIDLYNLKGNLNPASQAESRLSSFSRKERKMVICSTPLSAQKSIIQTELEKTTQYVYKLYCPGCRSHFKFNEDSVLKENEEFFLICALCKNLNPNKKIAIQKGKWNLEKIGKRGSVGFQFSKILSPTFDLDEFFFAKKERNRRDFLTDIMGLTYDDSFDIPFFLDLLDRRLDFFEDPILKKEAEEIEFITAGIDVQDKRIECEIVGWAGLDDGTYKSWSLEYIVEPGFTGKTSTWRDFFEKLWNFSFLGKKIKTAGIDTGFIKQTVFKALNDFRRTRSGSGISILPVRGFGWKNNTGTPIKYYNASSTLYIDTKHYKMELFSLIESQKTNFIFRPDQSYSYFKGLFSEVYNPFKGLFEKKHLKNEPLDCRVYSMAVRDYVSRQKNSFFYEISKNGEKIEKNI